MPRRTLVKVRPQYDDKSYFVESPAQSMSTSTSERPDLERKGTSTTLDNEPSDIEPWLLGGPYKYGVPKTGDPWETCFEKVKSYDDDMCEGWRGEIDNLLIFAGLFSAVVTAFLIESYQALQQDPNDMNTWLLEQILVQIHNANTQNVAALNAPLPTPPIFSPTAKDIRVNVFWFMSLTLSVAVVLVGILCTQWIREYARDTPLDPQDAIALRQIRHEGLLAWKVPSILMALPVMLHASLVLFFVGLIDLLWSLNHIVAFFVTAISGTVLLFIVATTFLPTVQLLFFVDKYYDNAQCAYKSAQSWVVHRMVTFLVKWLAPAPTLFRNPLFSMRTKYQPFFKDNNWVDSDMRWRKMRAKAQKEGIDKDHTNSDLVRGIVWIDKNLGQSVEMIYAIYHCIKDFKWVAQSKQVVSRISEKASSHLVSMSAYLDSASDGEQREVLSAIFLEVNSGAFPQLDQYQIESVIRILNTRLRDCRGKENIKMVESLPFLRWPFDNIRGMPEELATQLLLCTQSLVSQQQTTPTHEDDIWKLLQGILSNVREEHNPQQDLHRKLALDIILTFERNLEPADTPEVRTCIKRIVNTIPLNSLQDPEISVPAARVISAVRKRMDAFEDGSNAVFKTPDEKLRWTRIAFKSIPVEDARSSRSDSVGDSL